MKTMAVSTVYGGVREKIYVNGANPQVPAGYNVNATFVCMSNELSTPKILYCPADSGSGPQMFAAGGAYLSAAGTMTRTYATNFFNTDNTKSCFSNTPANLSYFVCGDAAETYPQMIMIGDRNIGTIQTQNLPAITTNTAVPASASVLFNWPTANAWWAWTAVDLHLRVGNVGMADGSAQQLTIGTLQTALATATNGASTTAPWYNFPQ